MALLICAFASPFAPGPPPPPSSGNEQHSSASIFEHVDRLSRSSEASRRVPSKIQLIAMQPIPAPPVQHPGLADRVAETNKINKEVFALFSKSTFVFLNIHILIGSVLKNRWELQCRKVTEARSC